MPKSPSPTYAKMYHKQIFVAILALAACSDTAGGGDPIAPPAGEQPTPTPTPSVLRVTPAENSIQDGDSTRLSATVLDAQGNELSDRPVAWSSRDTAVASVVDGAVAALRPGTVWIVATSGTLSDSARVDILQVPAKVQIVGDTVHTATVGATLTGITFELQDRHGLPVPHAEVAANVVAGGGSVNLAATSTDGDGRAQLSWTLGPNAGEQRIAFSSVSVPAAKIEIRATATPEPQPEVPTPAEVRITPSQITVHDGASGTLAAMALDEESRPIEPQPAVAWSSRDAAVASVAGGKVTGQRQGSTWIVARAGDLADSARVTVLALPAQIEVADSVAGNVGATLAPISLRVVDRHGLPVAGAEVAASVVAGGGMAKLEASRTDATGQSQLIWTLGLAKGDQRVEVHSVALPEVKAEIRATTNYPDVAPGECVTTGAEVVSQQADTVTTSSGLRYLVTRSGSGPEARWCYAIKVKLTERLLDGTVLRQGEIVLIPGLDKIPLRFSPGTVGMRVGEARRMILSPDLAYGAEEQVIGQVVVPPNSTIVLDVELIAVEP